MKCPRCNNELKLNPPVQHNVETYNHPLVAVALCCGKGVLVKPVRTIAVEAYTGDNTEDGWGYKIKK